MLLDEFSPAKRRLLPPPALRGRALLHGHCHQKAIAGMDSEIGYLKRIAGLKVEVPDSGCCGMAGAFGYERELRGVARDRRAC